ncbi:unnamed protein product, partial [Orchesella dallaii]
DPLPKKTSTAVSSPPPSTNGKLASSQSSYLLIIAGNLLLQLGCICRPFLLTSRFTLILSSFLNHYHSRGSFSCSTVPLLAGAAKITAASTPASGRLPPSTLIVDECLSIIERLFEETSAKSDDGDNFYTPDPRQE